MGCDLNHSEDQRQILNAAAGLLAASFPVSRAPDEDRGRMAEIAAFGAFALGLDEEFGGTGFTLVEEMLVHVLFGRHNVSTRSLAAPLAARIAAETGQAETARAIASGETAVCAALPAGDRLRLLDAEGAELAVVFAGRSLELIDIAGLDRELISGLGHGAALGEIPRTAGSRTGVSNSATLRDVADLLVAAQLLGIAEATRDLAVAYAGVRKQFGKPIGAFQAIKHHCANMAIAAETLSAQIDMAAIALRDGNEDAGFQVAAARLLAPRAALGNARLCIQVHGGIGFSAEADAHRHLKHAHVLRQLAGRAPMLELASPMAPLRS